MSLPLELVIRQQAEAAAMAVAVLQRQQQLRHKQQLRAEARRVVMTRNGLKAPPTPSSMSQGYGGLPRVAPPCR